MKRNIIALLIVPILAVTIFTGCTEANRVSYNISEEADNFNIIRRLVVVNSRSDKIIYELEGAFSIKVDHEDNQLEVTCETGENEYKKHFINESEYRTV